MRFDRVRRLGAGIIIASVLAACGGGGGGAAPVGVAGSDPVSTVNSLVATIKAKAFDKLPDLACAGSKSTIGAAFDPTAALGSAGALGVTGADVLGVVSVDMANVTVGSPAVTGDTAKVHVKADMKMTADQAKLKELIKKVLAAQGQATDDATVNLALGAAGTAFSRTQTIDDDVTLKNENGKWLLCE